MADVDSSSWSVTYIKNQKIWNCFRSEGHGEWWSQLSNPGYQGRQPFTEIYGDNLYADWADSSSGLTYQVYERPAALKRGSDGAVLSVTWGSRGLIAPDQEHCDNPVVSGGGCHWWAHTADPQLEPTDVWERYGTRDPVDISNSPFESRYCHTNYLAASYAGPLNVHRGHAGLWTEGTPDPVQYLIRCYRSEERVLPPNPHQYDPAIPWCYVDPGLPTPDPYCTRRQGYLDYGLHRIDYDSLDLVYAVPSFFLGYTYAVRLVAYFQAPPGYPGGNVWREQLFINSAADTVISFQSGVPETVCVAIPPPACCSNVVTLRLHRLSGLFSALEHLDIYALEPVPGDSFGLLASQKRLLPLGESADPGVKLTLPSVQGGRVVLLRYWLPTAGRATLDLYDVTGRRLGGLLHGKSNKGWNCVSLDMDAGFGGSLVSGTYFLRLEAGRSYAIGRCTLLR